MNESPEELPGLASEDSLDVPPFLRRANAAADQIIEAERHEDAAEPTFEEIKAVISQLGSKRDAIGEKIKQLKDELHRRIDAL